MPKKINEQQLCQYVYFNSLSKEMYFLRESNSPLSIKRDFK